MSAYSDLILHDRPGAYWPLQEPSGTASVAADVTGYGHDLALAYFGGFSSSSPHQPTFGAAGPFSGQTSVQSYVDTPGLLLASNPGTLPSTAGAFSWECWIYYDTTLPFATGLSVAEVLGWDTYAPPGGDVNCATLDYRRVGSAPPGNHSLDLGEGERGVRAACYAAPNTAPLDTWHHVVGTADLLAYTCTQWVDGVPLSLDVSDLSILMDTVYILGGFQTPLPCAAFWIMCDASSNTGFPGRVAHSALYDYALTPCQILSHYALATTGSYSPCRQRTRGYIAQ